MAVFSQNSPAKKEAFSVTGEELKDHMYYLASDAMEGRLPGTYGYQKAVEYVVSQFKQSKLKPLFTDENGDSTYIQKVPFIKYTWDPQNTCTVKAKGNKKTLSQNTNFAILDSKPYSAETLKGEIVFVSSGIIEPEYGLNNYRNVDVRGKWVVSYFQSRWLNKILPEVIIKEKQYNTWGAIEKLEKNAVDAGAIGLILVPSKQMLQYFPMVASVLKEKKLVKGISNSMFSAKSNVLIADSLTITTLFSNSNLNPISNDSIRESFVLRKTTMKLDKNVLIEEFESANVAGMIGGASDKFNDEIITLGAHLDHVGIQNGQIRNGADDNASGSIGVIEIAEELAKDNLQRPVIAVLYTAEEMGLLGSKYFSDYPPVPLESIKLNVNLDMIGRSDGEVKKGLAPVYADRINDKLKSEIVSVHKQYPIVELDWAYADTTQYGSQSDHYSFYKKGIPSVFFFNGVHADLHGAGDDPEKIDYEYFQRNCRFIYTLINEFAAKDNLILK